MTHRYLILSAAIAVALASAPAFLLAATNNLPSPVANVAVPRVTATVTDASLAILPKTHLAAVLDRATSSVPLSDATRMNHLQLILKPSASQTAAMESTISNQHDPKSAQFHHWLTPQQFGSQFGVADSDIAAVTSWLRSQGFTVNSVYPNKTQIDFSGTAAQTRQAFHTQENTYTIAKKTHVSNSSDISIPKALQDVVSGVMGLNEFRPSALAPKAAEVGSWNTAKKGFVLSTGKPAAATGQAVSLYEGVTRGLVPNDMSTIYGIRTLRANGVTGKGINIAVVEDGDMVPADWTNFVTVFNLSQFNGTFKQFNPSAPSGSNNCSDPSVATQGELTETVQDSEWATAIAPGANIWVASCSDSDTSNLLGGAFVAASNLVNAASASSRPDIISASYALGENLTDSASKTAIDQLWAQADAEGISVFVPSGNAGTIPTWDYGVTAPGFDISIDANALATSPHDTAVGGTEFADQLRGTTSQYFAPTPSVVGGTALSYVPEIPWNRSCGNGVAAVHFGFSSAIDFCKSLNKFDKQGAYATNEASSGAPSSVDTQPSWQTQVLNGAQGKFRNLPDVSLFAGSFFPLATLVVICTSDTPCAQGFTGPTALSNGTALSSPMFAGIQALIDQGLTRNGLSADQGNAAPTLYALATNEYGNGQGAAPASLADCNSNNGATGTASCVFHNVTSGSISSNCGQETGYVLPTNCYIFETARFGAYQIGLTTIPAAPTSYSPTTKAYPAGPGWSFASGLGSVNATNLLIAWRAYVKAPTMAAATK